MLPALEINLETHVPHTWENLQDLLVAGDKPFNYSE
jgi:hypothetical protein